MKKCFLFAFTHALPTAMALSEAGDIICSHAGDSYGDAIGWLLQHHEQTTLKDYDWIILDEKLVNDHIYNGQPISILADKYPDFKDAFDKNQEKKKKQTA